MTLVENFEKELSEIKEKYFTTKEAARDEYSDKLQDFINSLIK